MRLRVASVVAAGLALTTAKGCGAGDGGAGDRGAAPQAAREAVVAVMRMGDAAIGVDAAARRVTLAVRNAVVSPDRGAVAAVEHDGQRTLLRVIDAATGRDRSTRTLPGTLWPRAVSPGGERIVLVDQPPASPADGYRPRGRAATEVVVVRPGDTTAPNRIAVAANVEPEAFATDGHSLFVVEFSPPHAPDRYRVRRMDLEVGGLHDVFSVHKELQQDMRGNARTQAWSGDGRRLYTLYTVDDGEHTRAFVHVLDLEAQWAHCVDLPDGIGSGPLATTALTMSADDSRLHVLDGQAGRALTVATSDLSVVESSTFASQPSGGILAATGDGPDVFAALDSTLVVLRGAAPATTLGGLSQRPDAMAVAGDRVVVVASGTARVHATDGALEAELALPFADLASLAPEGAVADGRHLVECAC